MQKLISLRFTGGKGDGDFKVSFRVGCSVCKASCKPPKIFGVRVVRHVDGMRRVAGLFIGGRRGPVISIEDLDTECQECGTLFRLTERALAYIEERAQEYLAKLDTPKAQQELMAS